MPFTPKVPDDSVYGIFPTAYAASLARSTGDQTADAINQLTLRGRASGGGTTGGYIDAINKANQLGYDASVHGDQKDLDVAYINQIKPIHDAGLLRGVRPGAGSNVQLDDVVIAQGDARAIQEQQAQNYLRLRQGAEAGSKAGLAPDPKQIAGIETLPESDHLAPVNEMGYINPNDQAALDQAAAAKMSALAAQRRAANGEGKPTDDTKTEYNYIVGADGVERLLAVKRTTKGRGNPAPATGAPAGPAAPKVEKKWVRVPVPGKPGQTITVKNPNYKGP